MDPKNIERYSRWARPVLEAGVRARMLLLGIAAEGDASRVEPGAASAGGAVLSAEEARMRDALLAELDAKGEDELVRRAAYTWFNRLLALRYLELKGLLSHGRHVLSDATGMGMPPEAASEPEALNLPTFPREAALRLKAEGDVQATFRAVLVAQSDALAKALPKAFGPEGDPLALLLPDGLLGPEGAVRRLVEDVSAEDLDKPEALGWAYQYWVAEEKDSVFASFKKGKKAGEKELPVATQLFTPDWIVDYLVQNSLGRLWMLNVPDSPLKDFMPYYLAPEGETEPALEVSSPEEITFCDPACGSGHMMLAALRLLGAMYEEVGYRRRDIPSLVLANNLSGMEIDPRAAQLAELCLALEACSWDRNFLAKPTDVDIAVLQSVSIDPTELPHTCALARNRALLDALSHLSVCGSLLESSAKDISEIKSALTSLPGGLGDTNLRSRLESALASCEALSRHFSVVVTNPPYMGTKNMGQWLKSYIENRFPNAKRDLCTCFIERCLEMLLASGFAALVTMHSWMFIGSYEELRKKLLSSSPIVSMAHLGTRAFDAIAGEVVQTTAFVSQRTGKEVDGNYVRLVDFPGEAEKESALRETIQNPSCGWIYHRSAADFEDIPGNPIAYWASDAVRQAFRVGREIGGIVKIRKGLSTGNNALFVRLWWESNEIDTYLCCDSHSLSKKSDRTWYPLNKGGEFRKWYGNDLFVINWRNDGFDLENYPGSVIRNSEFYLKPSITWSSVSSGTIAFRYKDVGYVFEGSGPSIFGDEDNLLYLQGVLNSSCINYVTQILSPTINYEVGQVARYPAPKENFHAYSVDCLVESNRSIAKIDWDCFETSWNFKKHPFL